MQRVVLVCGFGGSGKSICSQLLWENLENVALVEADHFFRIKPFEMQTQEGRDLIGRIKLRNSICVSTSFFKEKFEYVIIDGLVWSQMELDEISTTALSHGYEVWCFWLKTSKDNRFQRSMKRGRDEADSQDFLDIVERTIVDPTPLSLPNGHYHEIVTDALSPEEVVVEMTKLMK
jgi:hypothetical protein